MRIILHVDMDAFFAACEERYNPQFAGKPIVIGADPKGGRGRGVVSTANYPARAYGIRSAMPISKAWALAEAAKKQGKPATIFLNGNHALYQEVSDRIMALLAEAADIEDAARHPGEPRRKFEQASIDEAYVDVSSRKDFKKAERLARALKKEIQEQEGLTASIGIGANKLIAKIASDFQKPDGLTVVEPEKTGTFLRPLPIRVIPGIGPRTEEELLAKRIRTVGDLQKISLSDLGAWFGKWGEDLHEKARGHSESPVVNEHVLKSVGAEETFETDTANPGFILDRARAVAAEVWKRFSSEGFVSFRTAVLKIRFSDFQTMTRTRTLDAPARREAALQEAVLRLLLPFLDNRENPKRKKIRLVGVRVEKLEF